MFFFVSKNRYDEILEGLCVKYSGAIRCCVAEAREDTSLRG